MGASAKQRIARIASLNSIVGTLYCIGQMIPYGLAGATGYAVKWFIFMIVFVAVGLTSEVAYYYYRGQADNGANTTDISVKALASASLLFVRSDKPKNSSKRRTNKN